MDIQKTLKIFFVGDLQIGLLIHEEAGEHGGHYVDLVVRPETARSILSERNQTFDLLITENQIRGQDDAGMELVRWVKANFPEMKVILMSGFSDNKAKALAARADAFWHKSCDLTGLLELINRFSKTSPRSAP